MCVILLRKKALLEYNIIYDSSKINMAYGPNRRIIFAK